VITDQTIEPTTTAEEVAGETAKKDQKRKRKNRGRGKNGKKNKKNGKTDKEKEDAGEVLTTKIVDDTVFKNPTVIKYQSEAATKRKEATRATQSAKFIKTQATTQLTTFTTKITTITTFITTVTTSVTSI